MVPKSFTLNREPHIKVGDIVTIRRKPKYCATSVNTKNPMNLEYPVTGQVKYISHIYDHDYRIVDVIIDKTVYGFSYDKDCYHVFENKESRVKELLRKLDEIHS